MTSEHSDMEETSSGKPDPTGSEHPKSESAEAETREILHRLSNAVSAITGNLTMLKLQDPEDEKLLKYINRMDTAAQETIRLLHRLDSSIRKFH